MFFRLEYLITMQNRLTCDDVQLLTLFIYRKSILPILFSFVDIIHELISLPLSLFQSHPKEKVPSQSSSTSKSHEVTRQKNCSVSREEVKFVMGKIELFCNQEGDEEIREFLGADELTAMFDESEPSLEELKQTFNVFDKNRDGFIDAEELHRVLGLLGSTKGLFIHDCNRMIARFDHNKDGKIDFNEFVKFMEIALS